jgi:hypothetical protein
MTVAKSTTPRTAPLVIYVEIHSRLVAWWLTYAWRSRQLSESAATLADADLTVAAATCARALLETAAASWTDARRLANVWAPGQSRGPPSYDQQSLGARARFITELNELRFRGKFSDRAPTPKRCSAGSRAATSSAPSQS